MSSSCTATSCARGTCDRCARTSRPSSRRSERRVGRACRGRSPWLRIGATAAALALAFVALYVLLPRIAGLDETWGRIRDGDPAWLALALAFEVLSYGAYVLVLRGVVGDGRIDLTWPMAWRLTLAGVAASRLLATAGAGGIALTAWALNRMGMSGREVATRMSAFFVLLYGVFMAAIVIVGLALDAGWLAGPSPFALTVVPALLASAVIAAALALALVPEDVGRARASGDGAATGRAARVAGWLAAAPATVGAGVRGALALVRTRDPALLGALGWWAFDVLVLWASLRAFGASPPPAVLVMSYFLGQVGNTLPLPGGIGGVEGGMIGALAAFGEPAGLALAGVLTYRAFAFWLPTVPGAIAYVQLTRALGHPAR